MTNFNLTDEQERIATSKARTLVVNAFAGSGKTSTLIEYAKRRPSTRIHYVAFNRSIKEEAAKKFPRNVKCVTTHGLAFQSHGKQFQTKLNNPRAYHVAQAINTDNINGGRILEVVTGFLSSKDHEIDESHIPYHFQKMNDGNLSELVDKARAVWSLMQDPNKNSVPMPHDGYLKLYHLSSPIIETQTILFDECQDANPVTIDLISSQQCNKVYVGDQYQSIYGFRGAVDALKKIKADERLSLTKSFRFGAGIADLASAILGEWRDCKQSIQGLGNFPSVFNVDRNQPHTIISRTNGCLFLEAVALVKSGKPFGFIGGVEGYRFDQILDTYFQFARNKDRIRDPFIGSFKDFAEMEEYGESLDDKEIKFLVKVVSNYAHEIPSLIDKIKSSAIPVLTGNEIALSTTHKMKGREAQNVILTDDFVELKIEKDEKGKESRPKDEEVNILYVAVTRSMSRLQLPISVTDWLTRTKRQPLLALYDAKPPVAQTVDLNSTASRVQSWMSSMTQNIDKVRDACRDDPEQIALVERFLITQSAKFKQP